MRNRFPTLMRSAVLAASMAAATTVAHAQAPAAPAPPAGEKPAPAPAQAGGQRLIPEVNITETPLSDVLNFLRDVDPSFQVVLAGPGASGGGPVIQELRLKNVSAPSVLQLLARTYPQIQVDDVVAADDGQGSTIYTVLVAAPRQAGGGDLFGGTPEADMGMPGEAEPRPLTIVRRLREIVDHLDAGGGGGAEDSRAKARAAVLSLVQATIETQGTEKAPATIKLHEPTETLIFKGTPAQTAFVDEALETLLPSKDNQFAAYQKQTEAYLKRIGQLEVKLAEVERKLTAKDDAPAAAPLPPKPGSEPKPKQ